MRTSLWNSFLLLVIAAALLPAQQSAHEVRAVWLSTASGDWPASAQPDEQRRSLTAIFDDLHRLNFNTVFFQVRPRGNTYYRSDIEPWAAQLSGALGRDPGWDPLAFAVEAAHARGMELHAWFNVAKVWGLDVPPTHPKHLFRTHREWLKKYDGEWWVDLGIPAARTYTADLVMELAGRYDVDGIHFDFIRYPGPDFDDGGSFRRWSDGMPRDEWRRSNVTAFVRETVRRLRAAAPWVKVGSAPVGIHQTTAGARSSFNGYGHVFQDSRAWLRDGLHDYLAPQIYWSVGEQPEPYDPDFESLCTDWTANAYGRHVYPGIGLYRDHVRSEMERQAEVVRESGAAGMAFFRYAQVRDAAAEFARLFDAPALIPPMRWRDSIPPLPPSGVQVNRPDGGAVIVRWNVPAPAADGEPVARYAVYRVTGSERRLAAVLPATSTLFMDERSGGGTPVRYVVTSLDRAWNESEEEKGERAAEGVLRPYAVPSVVVSQNYPEPFGESTFFTVSLRTAALVTVIVRSSSGADSVVLREQKRPGIHIVEVKAGTLPSGTAECLISAGGVTVRRAITRR